MMRAKGGRVMDEVQDKTMIKKAVHAHDKQMHGGKVTKLKKGGEADSDGGRVERAKGGRTKGKTNINIVIAQPKGQPPQMPTQGPVRPPVMPPPAQRERLKLLCQTHPASGVWSNS